MTTCPEFLRLVASLTVAALALAPAAASAAEPLADPLSQERGPRADLRVALLAAPGPSLDFDLLGDAPAPPPVAEDRSLRRRRKFLNWHQGIGLGLVGLQLGSTVTGQLNYNDKFGVSNTGRYKATHQVVTYTNLATFAVVGGLALLAPSDKAAKKSGFGRTTIHKVGMAVATAGMLGQGLLGIQTARREGYFDKQDYGRGHLALGYVTLAAMSVAVGAIVF